MVARWRAFGPWFEAHVANLRRELAAGRVGVRSPVEKVLDQLDGLARPAGCGRGRSSRRSRVEHPTGHRRSVPPSMTGLRAAVRDVIRPSMAGYASAVRRRHPAGRPPGRSARPVARPGRPRGVRQAGPDAHLAAADGRGDPCDRARGGRADRCRARRCSAGACSGSRTCRRSGRGCAPTPRSTFDTSAEVFAIAERSLARARDAIGDWFGILPSAPCVVVEIGEHEAQHSTIAYYREPATDGSRPGQYYINTYAPETRPRYEAEALAFHESIPGHHLQLAIGQELPDLPTFRRHLGPTAFVEGWGLYTERLSDEMGLYIGRPRPDRHALVRRLAGLPAGRRHRDARARLDPPAGDRLHARAHGAGPEQHRERGRPLHHDGRARRSPTRSASARSCGCAPRPRRRSAPGSTSAPSTTPCWGRGRSGLEALGENVRRWVASA